MSNGNGSPGPAAYEEKFADFIEKCREAKKNGVTTMCVHHPYVLGDNFEELIESLSRLADAGLALKVAYRDPS
jgi:dihydrodipicolinate synthase/N-acetylneuraminate lyase